MNADVYPAGGAGNPPEGNIVPWHDSQMFSSGKKQEDVGYNRDFMY